MENHKFLMEKSQVFNGTIASFLMEDHQLLMEKHQF